MDWKSLTSKMNPLLEKVQPYIKKLDPLVDKTKEMGVKTLDFTQKQLQNTPIVLKTLAEFDAIRTSKRLIVICYDEKDPLSREILLRSLVWATKAWSDAAELRFVEKSASPDIISSLGVVTAVDMRVWYIGEETFHASEVSSILEWWKTRNYIATENWEQKNNNLDSQWEKTPEVKIEKPEIFDPLAGK